jgi:hypothetical protein
MLTTQLFSSAMRSASTDQPDHAEERADADRDDQGELTGNELARLSS